MPFLSFHPVPKGIKPYPLTYLIITLFGVGRLKPASGTWGTLASIPIGYGIAYYFGPAALLGAALFTLIWGGVLITKYIRKTGKEDASEVVIDETVGMWIAAVPAVLDINYWIWAFLLFRFFDILKFGPIGYCDENIKGGLGVMLDDFIAGIISALIIILFRNELGELPDVITAFTDFTSPADMPTVEL